MIETLVLGNGISRLSFDQLIKDWPGEVWGCNRAYLDYPEKLSRLTGHVEVLEEAAEYREKHRLSYELWGGNLGNKKVADKEFTCPSQFKKDSGTTMVAQALHEGRNVAVCGFDLGGPDIHSPGIEKQLKHNWIERWRLIVKEYGTKNIRFIGHDHLPYIMSKRSTLEYSQRYRKGKPHIVEPDYIEAWEAWAKRPAFLTGEEYQMVRVRFKKNGYETVMNDALAAAYKDKGKVEILKEKKEEKPEPEKKPTAKKAEK